MPNWCMISLAFVVGVAVGIMGTAVGYSEAAHRGGWYAVDGHTYTIIRTE